MIESKLEKAVRLLRFAMSLYLSDDKDWRLFYKQAEAAYFELNPLEAEEYFKLAKIHYFSN